MTCKTDRLRILIYREGSFWLTQCLEYDIGSQGKTRDEALKRFAHTILGEFAACEDLGETLEDIGPAPEEFHEMWRNKEEKKNG